MLKFTNIFSLLVLILSVTACISGFQKSESGDNTQLAVTDIPENGIPVLKYHKGILEDFTYETSRWSSWSDKIIFSRIKDTLKIGGNGIGVDYASASFKFMPLDFTEGDVIKIAARSESEAPANVRIVLKDIFGREANAVSYTALINPGKVYNDYYFNFHQNWLQSWPDRQKVDSSKISQLILYINPGGPDFTGNLYIDKISVVKPENIPSPKPVVGGIIYNAKADILPWWSDKKFSIEKKDSAMVIIGDSVGPHYETFGRSIGLMNFKSAGVIRVKAKAQGNKPPTLVISVTDKDGHGTNAVPVSAKISNDNKYRNYFFDFTDKYKQVWPDTHLVNPESISSLIAFINPGKEVFTGKIYISEMEVITEKRAREIQNNSKNNNSVTKEQFLGTSEEGMSEWFTESDKIKISNSGTVTKVEVKDVGKLYEYFGKSFPSLDLSKTPIVKVRVKLNGDKAARLRLDLKDKNGFATNAIPVVKLISPGEVPQEITYDFSGKFEQSYPEIKKVDSTEISEILFFINPGEAPYTGAIIVEDIKAIANEP